MNNLSFLQELVRSSFEGLAQVVLLLVGGRFVLDWYDVRKKRRELEIDRLAKQSAQESELQRRKTEIQQDLTKFVREQQYHAVKELYEIFASYMSLFRIINSGLVKLDDRNERMALLKEIAPLEGRVDSVILRIASEFANKSDATELSKYLPRLRQSCQIWRERVRDGKMLPFDSSSQRDYMSFKTSFTRTAAYLTSRIYERLDPPDLAVEEAILVLTEVFDNKHEAR